MKTKNLHNPPPSSTDFGVKRGRAPPVRESEVDHQPTNDQQTHPGPCAQRSQCLREEGESVTIPK